MIPKVVFCPKCHKPVKTRIRGGENIQVLTDLTIHCGHKTLWGNKLLVACDGKVVIKNKKNEI